MSATKGDDGQFHWPNGKRVEKDLWDEGEPNYAGPCTAIYRGPREDKEQRLMDCQCHEYQFDKKFQVLCAIPVPVVRPVSQSVKLPPVPVSKMNLNFTNKLKKKGYMKQLILIFRFYFLFFNFLLISCINTACTRLFTS